MPWVYAALAVGAAVSGKAKADKQKKIAKESNAMLLQGRNDALQNSGLQGYADVGAQGRDRTAALLGLGGDPAAAQQGFDNYLNSSGYRFQQQAGTDALNSRLAASGMSRSGAGIKAAMKYGQGIGSSYFDNYLNQVNKVTDRGYNASQDIANIYTGNATQRANVFSQGYNDAANTRADAQQSVLNIFGSGMGNMAGGGR